MKRFAIIFLALTISSFAGPLRRQARQQQVAPKKAAVPIADAMDGYYMNRIKMGVGLSDEQVDKIAPFLWRMLRERREITQRRNRLMTLLRQSTNTGPQQAKRDATDEELAKLTRDLDQTETDRLASEQAFLKSVDPLLNDRQRARLRVFQDNVERQILKMLNDIQNPPAPATPPPTTEKPR